jgi:parallel beta-helix repeat protein
LALIGFFRESKLFNTSLSESCKGFCHMMRSRYTIIFLFLFYTSIPCIRAQKNILVPQDQPTIQGAINAASNGDTVMIAPGTYVGPFNFNGKAIMVMGSGSGVLLNGDTTGDPVVTFSSGETRSSVLSNVTVQNGSATTPTAGGIYVSQASPTIINSIVQNNKGCGIGVVDGAPLIQGNTITGNEFAPPDASPGCLPNNEFGGGGIVLYGAPVGALNAEIIGNTIENNNAQQGAAGIYAFDAGRPLIESNTIAHNMGQTLGSGITIFGMTSPVIVQNLIYENVINSSTVENPLGAGVGAGLNMDLTAGSFHMFPAYIVNNTFFGNSLIRTSRQAGSQIFLGSAYDNISFFNNLIVGTDMASAVDCLADPGPPLNLPVFDHNDVVNSGTSPNVYSGSCVNQTGLNGNISSNPNFATNTNSTYPYQLQLPSLAIDTGNNNAPDLPSLDFLGQPRLQNATGAPVAIIDIGAYEYQGIPGTLPPPPSFTLMLNPSSTTIQPGHSGTVAVTVLPNAADLGQVSLTCSGLPSSASCTLSPALINFTTTNPQSSTLTINIGSVQTRSSRSPESKNGVSVMLAGFFLLPLLLMDRPKGFRNSSWKFRLGAICSISLCAALSGCGKDQYLIIGPPQTYQVVVQGLAENSNITKQIALTVTVQQ